MQRDIIAHRSYRKCKSDCDHHGWRTDDILRRRQRDSDRIERHLVPLVHRCNDAGDHREHERQLQRDRNEREWMQRDIVADRGHRECQPNGEHYRRRANDILRGRQRDANGIERRFVSLVDRRDDAGHHREHRRQLQRDRDERERLQRHIGTDYAYR
jgi:hypothetical protein